METTNLQEAAGALGLTHALFWSFTPPKPLLGGGKKGTTQAFPGNQLWTEKVRDHQDHDQINIMASVHEH